MKRMELRNVLPDVAPDVRRTRLRPLFLLNILLLPVVGALLLTLAQEHGLLRPATVCQVTGGEKVCLHPSGGDSDMYYRMPWN